MVALNVVTLNVVEKHVQRQEVLAQVRVIVLRLICFYHIDVAVDEDGFTAVSKGTKDCNDKVPTSVGPPTQHSSDDSTPTSTGARSRSSSVSLEGDEDPWA